MLRKVVKDVVDAHRKSDEMFLALEEKHMKFEVEQEKREFQLQVMSMIYGRHSPCTPPAARPLYSPQATTNSFDPYDAVTPPPAISVYSPQGTTYSFDLCGQFQGYNN